MLIIPDDKVVAALDYAVLIDALEQMFCSNYQLPVRHHHFYKTAAQDENALILMPVWNEEYLGVKQVIVAPRNNQVNLPAIHAVYTLWNAVTGQQLAMMNAAELTSRRTACTSALAAKYLAPKNAKNLLVVGGGKVARHLVQAHSVVRPYTNIQVWMRDTTKLENFVAQLQADGINVQAATDIETAARNADVISTATLSPTPIVKGEWLKPGTHLDLIGSHKPDTRETDDTAITRSSVFVDTREGALHETGDLAIPIKTGVFNPENVKADIKELCLKKHQGRTSDEEITLFKSAGLAVEDLAAALLVYTQNKAS